MKGELEHSRQRENAGGNSGGRIIISILQYFGL